MCRKWILVLIVLCLSIVAQAEPNDVESNRAFVLTILGGPSIDNEDTQVGVWAGIRKVNTETGAASMWRMFTEDDTDADVDKDNRNSELALGVYGSIYMPELIDVNNFIPIPGLPEKLLSQPFFGGSIVADVKGKGAAIAPHTGVRVYETIGVMYQYLAFIDNDAKNKGLLTLTANFPF